VNRHCFVPTRVFCEGTLEDYRPQIAVFVLFASICLSSCFPQQRSFGTPRGQICSVSDLETTNRERGEIQGRSSEVAPCGSLPSTPCGLSSLKSFRRIFNRLPHNGLRLVERLWWPLHNGARESRILRPHRRRRRRVEHRFSISLLYPANADCRTTHIEAKSTVRRIIARVHRRGSCFLSLPNPVSCASRRSPGECDGTSRHCLPGAPEGTATCAEDVRRRSRHEAAI